MQDDDSDDDEYLDQVFGVTSCISCNGMQNPNSAVCNVMSLLSEKCGAYAVDDKVKAAFKKVCCRKFGSGHYVVQLIAIAVIPDENTPLTVFLF